MTLLSVSQITTTSTAFIIQQRHEPHLFHRYNTVTSSFSRWNAAIKNPNHHDGIRMMMMMMTTQPTQQNVDSENNNDNDNEVGIMMSTLLLRTTAVIALAVATTTVSTFIVLHPDTAVAAVVVDNSKNTAFFVDGKLSIVWTKALLSYSHTFFILLGTILLCYERFTVEANMSIEKEKSVVIADAMYGVVGAILAYTGYLRVMNEYGKGFEYYSHEPLFWFKLSAAGLLAGLSLFPTITFITRGIKLFQNEDIDPMSEALAKRVQKVLNAELSAILSVPLIASLMARGVSYDTDFNWQIGAGFTILTLVGSGAYYARQAFTWTEPFE